MVLNTIRDLERAPQGWVARLVCWHEKNIASVPFSQFPLSFTIFITNIVLHCLFICYSEVQQAALMTQRCEQKHMDTWNHEFTDTAGLDWEPNNVIMNACHTTTKGSFHNTREHVQTHFHGVNPRAICYSAATQTDPLSVYCMCVWVCECHLTRPFYWSNEKKGSVTGHGKL